MHPGSSSSTPNPNQISPYFNQNPNLEVLDAIPLLPEEIHNQIGEYALKFRDKEMLQKFLEITISKYGIVFRGLRLHPLYPYCYLFHIHRPSRLPKQALVFLWYLTGFIQLHFCSMPQYCISTSDSPEMIFKSVICTKLLILVPLTCSLFSNGSKLWINGKVPYRRIITAIS